MCSSSPRRVSASLNPSSPSFCWLCISASPCPVLLASVSVSTSNKPLSYTVQPSANTCCSPMFILQYTTADVRQGEAGRDQITIITQIENMKEAHLPAAKVPELKKKRCLNLVVQLNLLFHQTSHFFSLAALQHCYVKKQS